jgi:hypothetical protein
MMARVRRPVVMVPVVRPLLRVRRQERLHRRRRRRTRQRQHEPATNAGRVAVAAAGRQAEGNAAADDDGDGKAGRRKDSRPGGRLAMPRLITARRCVRRSAMPACHTVILP